MSRLWEFEFGGLSVEGPKRASARRWLRVETRRDLGFRRVELRAVAMGVCFWAPDTGSDGHDRGRMAYSGGWACWLLGPGVTGGRRFRN